MSVNRNQNDSSLYEETKLLQSFGDTTAKKGGNLSEHKLSREEHMIAEISGDKRTICMEGKKEEFDEELFEGQVRTQKAQKMSSQEERKPYEFANERPAYSGIYDTDKAVAVAVEDSSKEEQAFVYNIIRQNFLIENNFFLTEEERQANISLGMKKAEYAAKHFISEENKNIFLEEMEVIAKLASAGTADSNGKMDYGVKKGRYLGSGKNLIDTANPIDMMRRMDANAYKEYQKVCVESDSEDKLIYALKYLSNWYLQKVLKNPSVLDNYKKQSEEYIEKKVKSQKLDTTFVAVRTECKTDFLEGLKWFQSNRPNFLASIIEKELSLPFWNE